MLSGAAKQTMANEHVDDKPTGVDGNPETLDESDSFSDIDDVEVCNVLYNVQFLALPVLNG